MIVDMLGYLLVLFWRIASAATHFTLLPMVTDLVTALDPQSVLNVNLKARNHFLFAFILNLVTVGSTSQLIILLISLAHFSLSLSSC